jgi:MmyB-like transcription regulator ligand binding domain
MSGTPAFVLNGRLAILTANQLGSALYSPICADPSGHPTTPGSIFLDPYAGVFFRGWDRWPTTRSPCCEPRPPAIPATGSTTQDNYLRSGSASRPGDA